jgi:hypothetical protein
MDRSSHQNCARTSTSGSCPATTMQKAIRKHEDEGWIYAVFARATFVASRR